MPSTRLRRRLKSTDQTLDIQDLYRGWRAGFILARLPCSQQEMMI